MTVVFSPQRLTLTVVWGTGHFVGVERVPSVPCPPCLSLIPKTSPANRLRFSPTHRSLRLPRPLGLTIRV